MALIQISEPGQSSAEQKHHLAAGIDLGTTNSLVATVRDGQPETLADADGHHLLPSAVQYSPDASPLTGRAAKDKSSVDPQNTILSVKRLMGRGMADIEKSNDRLSYQFINEDSTVPRIKTAGGNVSPIEVSAEILTALKKRAEKELGDELEGVVVTVPAYFDDAQRQATKDAAKLAGLNILRLLNEPTAAAIAYGLESQSEGVYAIYDFGGGTFDISILRLNRGVFEVLATAGDSALGGDDLDHVITDWLIESSGLNKEIGQNQYRELWHQACQAKERLSQQDVVELSVKIEAAPVWQGTLSRTQLNELIDPLIRKTLAPCRRALRDAGVTVEDIDEIVMVGGSTRAPRVRELVGEFYGKNPLVSIDPDRIVALGAAIQADILIGNKSHEDILLLDVIPLSLGIETMGGLVEKVIRRNTTIPITRAQEFTTFKDGQTAMSVHVLQGERELVVDCRSLAKFELHDIPPMVAGAARIRVTFQVDADGLLSVTAQETTTHAESHVEVKPSYGLEDAEIERMLKDSISHASEDVEARNVREQQVEADRVLFALDAALQSDGNTLLTKEELSKIADASSVLRQARNESNAATIKKAIKDLDKETMEFAARRMDKSIHKALTGHSVTEFNEEN